MSEKSSKKRIMFVDDDLDSLEMYELAAAVPDTIIAIKRGALSALRFLNELNYDVDAVILDLSMPDMDGLTLTQQIRRNENLRSKQRPIQIYWFTGWPFDENNPDDPITLAKNECKVSRVFTKPHDATEIIYEVKRCLN